MKISALIILSIFIAGCSLVKPLPGNDTITVGKEGFGIDRLADKVVEKVDKTKTNLDNFRKTGVISKEPEEPDLKTGEEYAELINVAKNNREGQASRIYKDGQFTLKVISELPLLENDYLYECWLLRDNPIEYINVGQLTQETDEKYHLNFIVNKDYTDYNKVVITLEPNDENPAPSSHILEGVFK